MKDKIRELIHLQDCDNRIKKIIDRKNEGPLRIQRLEAELQAYESRFQDEHTRLEALKKNGREIEQNIQNLEDSIEKSNIKLSNIKSNKEYTAALKEIGDLQKIKLQIEDSALEVLEEIENLEKRCSENKQKQSELRMQFQNDKDAIEKKLDALQSDLETQQTKGSSLSEVIDRDLLKDYLFYH